MPSWFTVVCAMFPLLWMLFNNNFGFTAAALGRSRNSASLSNNHKINPKPCSVNGLEGTCMFVWECINTEGQHIGMCMDTFMFGSCCAHNLTASQVGQLPDSSEPAILYTHPVMRPIGGSNRPGSYHRPKPAKQSTTPRPTFYLPNHNDGDRGSPNARPVHNQIRPSNLNYNSNSDGDSLYSGGASMDKLSGSTLFKTKQPKPPPPQPPPPQPPPSALPAHSHILSNQPSQHFVQNLLPDRLGVHEKPDQPPTSHPSPVSRPIPWNSSYSEAMQTDATSNVRPNFISRPTVLSTVLSAQHRPDSSHIVISTATSTTMSVSTTTDNWHNQNWESNEIEDVSNHIDTFSKYPIRPWHSTTFQPSFMSWAKPASSKPPQFVTKAKPWQSLANKQHSSTSTSTTTVSTLSVSVPTTTHKYHTYRPHLSIATEYMLPAVPSSTISSTTYTGKPSNPGGMSHLVSASITDKGTQCGVSPMQPPRHEIRIVGGRNAQFGVWAWQVSVRRTSFFGFSSTHRCGGALLNENWIATAGHCVDDLLTSQIKIRVGEYDFSSIQEPYPFAERGVTRKVVHPKYNFFTYEYDLAMVRLDSPLEYAPHIVPICLPGSDDLLIGENATVTGWGRLSEGGTLPSVLQESVGDQKGGERKLKNLRFHHTARFILKRWHAHTNSAFMRHPVADRLLQQKQSHCKRKCFYLLKIK